jgi:hypoxanthine phosphoribosyltransferase
MLKPPSNYSVVLDRNAIFERVAKVAKDISAWAREAETRTGQQVLAVCILRGGVFFFSDLLRAVDVSMEPAFCRCRSYSSEVNGLQSSDVHVTMDQIDMEGRAVLLVDDICDSGSTLTNMIAFCLRRGAVEVKSSTLIFRHIPNSSFKPEYPAMDYHGNEWFAGYGMEDANRMANLPEVYIIKPV